MDLYAVVIVGLGGGCSSEGWIGGFGAGECYQNGERLGGSVLEASGKALAARGSSLVGGGSSPAVLLAIDLCPVETAFHSLA